MELAWQILAGRAFAGLLTDRYRIEDASAAYESLSAGADGMLGTLFSYADTL